MLMSVLSVFLSVILAVQPSFLDSLSGKAADGCVEIDYEYVAVTSGIRTSGDGKIQVQGSAYHMVGNGMEIYCDGDVTWLVDESAMEVMIESADSPSAGYLANPVMLLMNMEESVSSYKEDGNRILLELPDGTGLEITVKDMRSADKKKPEAFRPPTVFGSDWIVTDMRQFP